MKEPVLAKEKIAIIGMACRFPGHANNYESFYENLVQGKDCLINTPKNRFNAQKMYSKDKAKSGRLSLARGGFIDGFDEFDASFFGIGPREAEAMDPQQRKLLELSFDALQDAGQDPFALGGEPVGVFVGGFTLDYKIVQFADLDFLSIAAHTATGTMMTLLSNRISYFYDFRGPSMSVDTACSSSLVTVHLACQSLLNKESNMALAGGVLLQMTPQYTIAESKGGFLSAEGKSKTFDASANGYVRSEGVGLIVLKRLSDAIKDKDRIHSVIIGSGVNQDGKTNGITVPNPKAQIALIKQVCQSAGIEPKDLQYVEAHGTSTPTGDPIEANALAEVLSEGRKDNEPCYIGSVKTNIGHTESAAGIAGLIKTCLSIKNSTILPHINLEKLNPLIDLENKPIKIAKELKAWPKTLGPKRAGVNSFGFGGTNAHVLLEEAPAVNNEESAEDRGYGILCLSAKDESYFPRLWEDYRNLISEKSEVLPDLAFSLARHQALLPARSFLVYKSASHLVQILNSLLDKQKNTAAIETLKLPEDSRKLAWVFTGMGPQWWGMGRELFSKKPVFRQSIEACHEELKKWVNWSLIDELNKDEKQSFMEQTWLAQPSNFAMQLALSSLWRSYGLSPDGIIGHSTGEAAAFYEAGVYSFSDAVKIIAYRSSLQQKLHGTGTMLAAALTEDNALKLIEPFKEKIAIGAINSPTSLTLAGDKEALEQVAKILFEQKCFNKFLTVQVPYHSPKMDLIKEELLEKLKSIKAMPAKLPLYLTAKKAKAHGPELEHNYWWDNVRGTVYFSAAINQMAQDGFNNFLEIGPHPVLGHAINECLEAQNIKPQLFASCRKKEDEEFCFKRALAQLMACGFSMNKEKIWPHGKVISLPSYPFKQDRFWHEARWVNKVRTQKIEHPLLGLKTENMEPIWELNLDLEQIAFLADHVINEQIICPAAAFIEMVMQGLNKLSPDAFVSLSNLYIEKALFLSFDRAAKIQIAFDSKKADFSISSKNQNNEPVTHFHGKYFASQPKALGQTKILTQIESSFFTKKLGSQDCYELLKNHGYEYQGVFKGLKQVWLKKGQALASIDLSLTVDDRENFHCHPAILDASFQALLLADFGLNEEKAPMRLPLKIDEIVLPKLTSANQTLYAHAVLTSVGAHEIKGDIFLLNEQGQVLGEIRGFVAANLENAAQKINQATLDQWLKKISFKERELIDESGTKASESFSLILACQSFDEKLLSTDGIICRPGSDFSFDAKTKKAIINIQEKEHWQRLFNLGQSHGVKAFTHIVHLWSLDAKTFKDSSIDDLGCEQNYASFSLISLSQVLQKLPAGLKLSIVTKSAIKLDDDSSCEPLAASFWGLARVLSQQELLQHKVQLIDINDDSDKALSNALHESHHSDDEELVLRKGKVFKSTLEDVFVGQTLPMSLRQDGTYLVTGAFGALGQVLCKKLIESGARRLVLFSRTDICERKKWAVPKLQDTSKIAKAISFIKELEALGAEVICENLNIADAGEFNAWYQQFKKLSYPPIRGVFHLAGQVKDNLLENMTLADFNSAYEAKVKGSFNLHQVLKDEPLDHFVLFSSIASILTTAGQTNYAAGNAFMDGLAHFRRAAGLSGLSINWGPWATGMIEDLGLIEHYRNARGMSSLAKNTGMEVFEKLLSQNQAQVLVATVVDWPLFLGWYNNTPQLLQELIKNTKNPANANSEESFLTSFTNSSPDERLNLLTKHFKEVVADSLRIVAQNIDTKMTLNELGLDSLLAIELRAKIQREFKVALPVVTLLGQSPISALVEELYQEMLKSLDSHEANHADLAFENLKNESEYPLTHNQQALWFLKHLDPDGFAYNIGGAVKIKAKLEPELMLEAVRKLIMRHPLLRANFIQKESAVQVISPDAKEDLVIINVEGKSFDDVYQMIINEYRKPYDLAQDPLMRFRLFRLADDSWVMMKAVHHIISDAISTFTFIEELLALYEGMRKGQEPVLPKLEATYLDFVNWQRQMLGKAKAQKMLSYWQEHLPKKIPALNLPTDKVRPQVLTHNGSSHFFILNEELSQKAHSLAKEQGMTVFMVLLAAFYTLLHRYSGQDEIIVGSPVLGRTEEKFASVYGYFVNPLPLVADFSKKPNSLDLLKQVQKTVLNGLDNQEYPFMLLVEKLKLPHDPSRSRVFQAMFILLAHKVSTEKYGYRLDYIELPEEEGQFDITMSAYEEAQEKQFHCVFKYNSDLFSKETIEQMAEHYQNILQAMLAQPEEKLASIKMLSDCQIESIVNNLSGEKNIKIPTTNLIEMIRQHALSTPKARALSWPQENGEVLYLSYDALDKASDVMARFLLTKGIKQGSVVGLALPKSFDLIICLLGILKAQAAYLPLDPNYPSERLAYMLDHAKADLLLTKESLSFAFKSFTGDKIYLEEIPFDVSEEIVLPSIASTDLAYVIYTSGSTGKPKAVSISHGNMVAVFEGWQEAYGLGKDVFVHGQMASFSFDVFAGDLLRALGSGGTLVLIDRDILLNTERLYQTLLNEKVDCAEFVPATIRLLARHVQENSLDLGFIKLLIVGSDSWTMKEATSLMRLKHPKARLINSYGLSEACIDSSYFEIFADTSTYSGPVPIGKPFKNSTIFILDKNNQLTAPLVVGEIYLGGLGISAGYYNDPGLTSERFVNIKINNSSHRLYKSGDLAYYDKNGNIRLVGRADSQVKVYGHRIELSEIEKHLEAMESLSQAVVTARANKNGEKNILAYVVSNVEHLDISKLKNALQKELPAFMIPSHIEQMESLPLSPNGKVDLAALPMPAYEQEKEPKAEPKSFYEKRLAFHWQELLATENFGLNDDFFAIGGTSIKLIELIYRLQKEFNISMAVSDLFRDASLLGMAQTLEDIIIGKKLGQKAYLQFNETQAKTIFCFPPAGGHGLVYRELSKNLPDYKFISFNYLSDEEKIKNYADIIMNMAQGHKKPILLGYSLGGNLAFLVAKELESRGQKIEQVIIVDSYRISEKFKLEKEHLNEFEKELAEHIFRHTGSKLVAKESMEQARDYINFCSQTLNDGKLSCQIAIISDQDKTKNYLAGQAGSWHGCSKAQVELCTGFGSHGDMMHTGFIEENAQIIRRLIKVEA